MTDSAQDYVLNVTDVNVKLQDTSILHDVTFTATSGNILAIMGPTGSGKTTLLNSISGRIEPTSGHVTLNQKRFSKRLRRRLGFVLQQDVFLSNLTLWETLYFTAMIRISEKVSRKEKLARLDDIIDRLDIRGCLNTVIGGMFTRGLSGGEKKRASIACELLTDPDILLLDEPTSGLDSSTALSLMKQIQLLAESFNKMVILTIHQPSSQIYQMIESLLLLTHGQVAYFGKAHEHPSDFFRQFNFICEPHFNPADFYLEILKSDEAILNEIIAAHRKLITTKIKEAASKSANDETDINRMEKQHKSDTATWPSKDSVFTTRGSTDSIIRFDAISSVPSTSKKRDKWPTSFQTQFKMLTWRNFKQSKGRILHLYDVIKYIVVAAIIGTLYYQIQQNEDTVRDRVGLLYFILTFWTFEATIQTIFGIPEERGVIAKERTAGSYRLSAYYLAKTVSELPLHIVGPLPYYAFVYWMAGLGDVSQFFSTLSVLLLATITAQGLGLLIGCTIMDVKMASNIGTVIILVGTLFSGFITITVPEWLSWGKYLSIINYPQSAMSILLFQDMDDIPCNATSVSTFPQCLINGTDHVTSDDVLRNFGIDIPLYCHVSSLVLLFFVLRLAAYVALRCRHTVLR